MCAMENASETSHAYLRDRRLTGEMVVEELVSGPVPIVRCSETWFHPQGGGQQPDQGRIGPARVIDARLNPTGSIDHYVDTIEGLKVGVAFEFAVDGHRRFVNSAFHTGAHLLVNVVMILFPSIRVTRGHQWPGEARVEFSGPGIEDVQRDAADIERAVQRQAQDGLHVTLAHDPGGVRHVSIGHHQPIACNGTHVLDTAELGFFRIRSVKLKRDRLQIGYEVLAPDPTSASE